MEVNIHPSSSDENSFLPRIRARLEPHGQGSRLAGTMSLHTSIVIFLTTWAAGVMIAIPRVVSRVSRGEPAGVVVIPIAMLGFVYVLTSASFGWEAAIARRRLAEILASGEAGMDEPEVN